MANNKMPEGELRTLRSPWYGAEKDGGDIAQRDTVHISILAEGYRAGESEVFFGDAARLAEEVFFAADAPFRSLKPLLSVHAVMVVSEDAGVEPLEEAAAAAAAAAAARRLRRNDEKTNNNNRRRHHHSTAFSLRREDGPLRTVAPPGSGRDVYRKAKRVCAAVAPGCDHVLLMARDEWYGGLGDEVAIFTASPSSGALALRHELGHILADIGEEYDGGSDYSGPNFSESTRLCRANEQPRRVQTVDGVRQVWPCVSWGAWLTTPPEEDGSSSSIGGSSVGSNKNSNAQVDRFVGSRGAPSASMALAAWPFAELSEGRAVEVSVGHAKAGLPGTKVDISVAGISSAFGDGGEGGVGFGYTAAGALRRIVVAVGQDQGGEQQQFEVALPAQPTFDRIFYAFTVGPLGSGGSSAAAPLTVRVRLEGPTSSSSSSSPDAEEAARRAAAAYHTPPPPPLLCHVQVHQYATVEAAERAAAATSPRHQQQQQQSAASPPPLSSTVVGAFPVFDGDSKLLGYRPTDEACLMRNMDVKCFCPVCLERLWRRVLTRTGILRSSRSSSPSMVMAGDAAAVAAASRQLRGAASDGLSARVSPGLTVNNASSERALSLSVRPAPLSAADGGGAASEVALVWERLVVRRRRQSGGGGGGEDSALEVVAEEHAPFRGLRTVTVPPPSGGSSSSSSSGSISANATTLGSAPAGEQGACWRVKATLRSGYIRSEPRLFETARYAYWPPAADARRLISGKRPTDAAKLLAASCKSTDAAGAGSWLHSSSFPPPPTAASPPPLLLPPPAAATNWSWSHYPGASHDDGATMSGATGFALPLPPIPDVFDAGPSRVLLLLVVLLAAAAASPVSASLKQQQGPCRSKRRVL
jgi:hypothetical protein